MVIFDLEKKCEMGVDIAISIFLKTLKNRNGNNPQKYRVVIHGNKFTHFLP